MRKHLSFVVLAALLTLCGSANAQSTYTMTVAGTGAGSFMTDLPAHIDYKYGYSQQIFKKDLLSTTPVTITALRFHLHPNNKNTYVENWKVYLGNTSKNSFASHTDWIPVSDMQEVFDGSLTLPEGGEWVELTLSTPFVYTAIDNLVLAVDNNTGSYKGNIYFTGHYAQDSSSLHRTGDGTDFDPASISSTIGSVTRVQSDVEFVCSMAPTVPSLSFSISMNGADVLNVDAPGEFTATTSSSDLYTVWYSDGVRLSSFSDTVRPSWPTTGAHSLKVYGCYGPYTVADSIVVAVLPTPQVQVASATDFFGIEISSKRPSKNHFVRYNPQNPNEVEILDSIGTIYAAEYVDGTLFYYDYTQDKSYRAPFNPTTHTLGTPTELASLDKEVCAFSYNVADSTLYAIIDNFKHLAIINDLSTGSYTLVGESFPYDIYSFAINGFGDAYGIAWGMNKLYRINLATAALTEVGPTGLSMYYVQGMSFDRSTGELVWAFLNEKGQDGIYRVNVSTGQASLIGRPAASRELCGLFSITDAPSEISIVAPATAVAGQTVELLAVGPADGTYIWTLTGATPAASAAQMATATFDTPGTYTVSLMAVAGGSSSTLTHTITVTAAPLATLVAPDAVSTGEEVDILAAGPSTGTYVWSFPGATPSSATGKLAKVSWADSGNYTITLTATVGGQTETYHHTVRVVDPYAVSIVGPSIANAGTEVTLSIDGPSDGTYIWNLQGANPSGATGESVTTTWNAVGDYTITVTAVVAGQSRTASHSIHIIGENDVAIDAPASATVGETVTFNAVGPEGTYIWSFPEASPAAATGKSVSTTWTTAGTYTVNLTAVIGAESKTQTHTITIKSNAGITDVAKKVEVSLAPNPTTGIVRVECAEQVLHIELYSIQGTLMHSADHTMAVDLTAMPQGVYLLRIVTANGTAVRRVVKQ